VLVESQIASDSSKVTTTEISDMPTRKPAPEAVTDLSYDERVQKMMDEHKLGWAVQYEIARGVSDGYWGWDTITEDMVKKLTGTNANAAPLVTKTILPEGRPIGFSLTERQKLIL
jgi:hypothetical protein